MKLQEVKCKVCGGKLEEKNGLYVCAHCGGQFKEESITEQREQLLSLFGELLFKEKEEKVANVRNNLWEATHAAFIDNAKVVQFCRELRSYLPEDFQSKFYEVATIGTKHDLNVALDEIDEKKDYIYIEDAINFVISSLDLDNVSSLKKLIGKAFAGEKAKELITQVEAEAEKVKSGIYSPLVPRDVFIAYSSKDIIKVHEIVSFLERNELECFVAERNMRHGKGAKANYEEILKKAMHNCNCIVFISSSNSRSLSCDALTVEIPYMQDNERDKGRIEFIIDSVVEREKAPLGAKRILDKFFKGLECCTDKEDLFNRIFEYRELGMGGGKKDKPAADDEAARKLKEAEQKLKAQQEEFVKKQYELEELNKRLESVKNTQSNVVPKPVVEASYPTLENYDKEEFEIVGTVLKEYISDEEEAEVKIPFGVTEIGEGAFEWCEELKNITIPNSVNIIGASAFYNCSGLKNITIPNSVNIIGAHAFDECSGLKSITIPNSVTAIGEFAFSSCSGLNCITIPNGVTKINKYAFSKCSGLKNITIPNSVTTIRLGAFYDCSELKSITIPNSVTTIGEAAFAACTQLSRIIFEGTKEQWYAIEKGNGWDKIAGKYVIEYKQCVQKVAQAPADKRSWYNLGIKVTGYKQDAKNVANAPVAKSGSNKVNIKVFGVGGAGNSSVNRMLVAGVQGAEFYAVNTDALLLSHSPCKNKLQIGSSLTKGMKAGGDPKIGRAAAEESKEAIIGALKNTDLLVLTAGMGGGTGTGAVPVIAKLARDRNILTVAFVTMPFSFEGLKRKQNTDYGLSELKKYVDTLIAIPNDNIKSVVPKGTPLADAFKITDALLKENIRMFTELIGEPSLINIDFEDVKCLLKNKGLAYTGSALVKGKDRIADGVKVALNDPLMGISAEGARGVIISVTGGNDLTMDDVSNVANYVKSVADASANVIFGARIDPKLNDEVQISIIATELQKKK